MILVFYDWYDGKRWIEMGGIFDSGESFTLFKKYNEQERECLIHQVSARNLSEREYQQYLQRLHVV